MNKLLTSLLVTVSLAVALFANAQETPDYTVSSTKEEIVPTWLELAVEDMSVEEREVFINFLLERDIYPHKDGSNYYDMEFNRNYSDSQVVLQDLQDALNKLPPPQRAEKFKKWDELVQKRNQERANQFTPENVAALREEAEQERIKRNKEIADTNRKHGLSIPEIPAPNSEDLAASDAYTPSVYEELTLSQHFAKAREKSMSQRSMEQAATPTATDREGEAGSEEKRSFFQKIGEKFKQIFSPSEDKKEEKQDAKAENAPIAQETAVTEKPQSQPLDPPFPQKQGLEAWRQNIASAIPPEAIEYANQQNALRAQREEERKAQTAAAEQVPAEEKKGLLAKIFSTPAGQQVAENIRESFKQSSLAKEQEKKDTSVLLNVKNMVERKAPLDHLQLEVADPFANNIPSFAKQQAMPRNRRSVTNASFSTLFDGLRDGNTQIASIPIADEKPPVITPRDPGASADNALDKEKIKEGTKKSLVKSYAPWAQALYSVTEKVKHTVRTAPKASSTKKMDPSMQQLTKNIRDRLHSHELLKGYYVAVVNIDAVGVEGLATLHEFLNLKLSEAKAPNAPKEFGKDSQFPYFRMLDKDNRMEVAFTNDIRLRIQANQKKMDLYRLSCEKKVCTTDNKQVAGNKNNEATVHIIR